MSSGLSLLCEGVAMTKLIVSSFVLLFVVLSVGSLIEAGSIKNAKAKATNMRGEWPPYV